MFSTTPKTAASLPCRRFTAATMKMVEVIPDMTFTRTGVPNRWLKTPNQPMNAPS